VIDANAPRVAFDQIDSTNAEAARRAQAGDFGPVWLRAGSQSAGRGRRGRAWVSDPGNLFLTYLTASGAPPAILAQLSFATALAVADTVDNALGRAASVLKWPNDVLVLGRKVSGILLESGPAPGGLTWLAIGVGVNIVSAPADTGQPVSSLSEFSPPKPVIADGVEATLRRRLAFWAGALDREGFSPLREAWITRAHGLGSVAVARLGNEEVVGVVRGLSADGALELELPDMKTRLISAGEIFFGGAAG
jgi:BirA family biotin operon repressor/biotin-[acetyl-CoA-carboxylase] ligase